MIDQAVIHGPNIQLDEIYRRAHDAKSRENAMIRKLHADYEFK